MDISLSEGELMAIHNDFHHAHYDKVLEFDDASLSDEAKLPTRILKLRAQIALGQQEKVLSATKSDASDPSIAAVRALATYTSGKKEAGLTAAEKLAAGGESASAPYVQVLAGTVLVAEGKYDEAQSLLSANTNNSLEAVAVLVQLHLANNRVDLATKEVQSARRWAQDSTLFNIADSWVGLRVGGERYQQAFYEFEEMPVPQAIAELHLGRLPEAEAALSKQLAEGEDDVDALANSVVLQTLNGKRTEAEELKTKLKTKSPEHPLLVDLKAKSDLFDEAASKFTAKVAS